ncbi:spermidine/putrescine ABC transporter substrate-binding protein [Nodularia harveyana UHCC-0300]|uniref:Spermidine/putrescine ABC transporter substrate-binding protein n=1 Tax=Nodularia harveyana UHCC-0300 TaxID=2974287 RepID=A0ABU5U8S9_9CYAN|nr:spermidine/putrescine ABC transporter substrate-binding protein [Nodularia harveyana]MEA5579778.1 spermidine/putrescine ABC transporter substrate-binding protein [Nodularia harveyana UHCC-0300]
MKNRRQFLQAIAALSSLSLASCGWKLGNVKSSNISPRSDQLDIFTWTQYYDKQLLETFTTQTGLKVLVNIYDSNEVMLAKITAGGGSTYSVIYPSDYMVQKMVEDGLLTEINHDRLTGLKNLFPEFQNPSYDPNNRHSIPFNWGTTGFIYDSAELSDPPEDWEYLWQNREQLNRRITLLNDVREVMGAVLRMLGYSYNSQDENQLKEAYQKLVELKPAIASFDTDAWQNQLLAGDLTLAMCYSADAIRITQENPRFKYIIPRSGSSLWTDTIVIPNTSPNLDGAYAWINFMLQPEVAASISERLSLATPNSAGFEQLPKNIQNNPSWFPPEYILKNCERIQPLGDFEDVYERYWTELTIS